MSKLMTVVEVAKLLQVSPQTVAKLEKDGVLGSVRFGSSLRFSDSNIEKFLKKASRR